MTKGAIQTLPRNTKDLIDLAKKQGWEHSRQSNGHHRLVSPEGKVVGMSGTPSDFRAVKNFRMQLKRAGLRILAKIPKEKQVSEQKTEVVSSRAARVASPIRGMLKNIIIEYMEKHDRPEGIGAQEIFEQIEFKLGRGKIKRTSVPASLSYYTTQQGGNVLHKVGYARYRLTRLYAAGTLAAYKAAPAAAPTPTNSTPAPQLPDPPSLITPVTPAHLSPDDELDQLLDTIVSALGRVQLIVGQTKEARRKLREIIGAI